MDEIAEGLLLWPDREHLSSHVWLITRSTQGKLILKWGLQTLFLWTGIPSHQWCFGIDTVASQTPRCRFSLSGKAFLLLFQFNKVEFTCAEPHGLKCCYAWQITDYKTGIFQIKCPHLRFGLILNCLRNLRKKKVDKLSDNQDENSCRTIHGNLSVERWSPGEIQTTKTAD